MSVVTKRSPAEPSEPNQTPYPAIIKPLYLTTLTLDTPNSSPYEKRLQLYWNVLCLEKLVFYKKK